MRCDIVWSMNNFNSNNLETTKIFVYFQQILICSNDYYILNLNVSDDLQLSSKILVDRYKQKVNQLQRPWFDR